MSPSLTTQLTCHPCPCEGQVGPQCPWELDQPVHHAHIREQPNAHLRHGKHRPVQ